MEIIFKISEPYFKDLLEKLPIEIVKLLDLKEESKKEYGKDKFKGKTEDIIKEFVDFFNKKIRERKLITNIKIIKIKRIWNSNDLVVHFEYLYLGFDKKLELELLESKKDKNYVLELKLKIH